MKNIARVALKPGMVLADSVKNSKGDVILYENTILTEADIMKLARYQIMVVEIKEDIDFATTHFEKMHLTPEFKEFERVYNEQLLAFKAIMITFISNGLPFQRWDLLDIYKKILKAAGSSKFFLDYLYNMLPSEDDMTYAHCLNSALIAGAFSDYLGMNDEQSENMILSGFLYDVGKMTMPNSLIWKPGKLTDLEFSQMKMHTFKGFEMLSTLAINEHVKKAALMHHERCDGSGYPSKLKGDKIDGYAKYMGVIDSYEAMTSPRTYRESMNPFQVIANFERTGLEKYDIQVIKPILYHVAKSQLGLNTRLSDDRIAEIILINQDALSKPLVKLNGEDTVIDLREYPDLEIVAIY